MSPESPWNGIGRIEPPAVGTALEPMGHHMRDIIRDGGLVMIESDKLTVAFERRIIGLFAQSSVRRPGQAKPGGFR